MDHVTKFLSDFLDGRLSELDRRKVDAHLSECAACRQELSELKGVVKLVADLPKRELPKGFLARLEQKRRAEEVSSRAPAWLGDWHLRGMALAMTGVLVCIVAFRETKNIFKQTVDAPISSISGAVGSVSEPLQSVREKNEKKADVRADFKLETAQKTKQAAPYFAKAIGDDELMPRSRASAGSRAVGGSAAFRGNAAPATKQVSARMAMDRDEGISQDKLSEMRAEILTFVARTKADVEKFREVHGGGEDLPQVDFKTQVLVIVYSYEPEFRRITLAHQPDAQRDVIRYAVERGPAKRLSSKPIYSWVVLPRSNKIILFQEARH